MKPHEVPITWFAAMTTYAGYAVLIMFGHIRDWFGRYDHTSVHNLETKDGTKGLLMEDCIMEDVISLTPLSAESRTHASIFCLLYRLLGNSRYSKTPPPPVRLAPLPLALHKRRLAPTAGADHSTPLCNGFLGM